jgi:LmbE family N-acetylglucosaminyl deacetylase
VSAAPFQPWRGFTPLADGNAIARGPVLVFAPHPDDEVIGCGGTLAFHSGRGDAVHVLQMTGGERGDPRALAGDAHARERDLSLVATRLAESRAAAAIVGVQETVALGFPDGRLVPDDAVVERLAAEVRRVGPAVAYAPSPLECHPDHLATCVAAAAALAKAAPAVRFLMFEVNHPTLASFLLDVTPWIGRKRDALAQFKSQLRYTDLVGKSLAGAYARTVNVDLPPVQYAEAFLELAPARVAEFVAELAAFQKRFGLP